MDLVFADSLYWLFNDYNIKLIIIGSLTALALFISLFHVIRKWGEL